MLIYLKAGQIKRYDYLELSNYATKYGIEKATGIDTSEFSKQFDLDS